VLDRETIDGPPLPRGPMTSYKHRLRRKRAKLTAKRKKAKVRAAATKTRRGR